MASLESKINDFLSQKNIGVVGVSNAKPGVANSIYKKLRDSGYQVYAINPNADEVEGDTCYPSLESTPVKVDAVVIGTRPEVTEKIVEDCERLGIKRVWMHHSFNALGSSRSDKAVEYCHEHDISVIPAGCPMMFCEPVDFGHKCMRWMARMTGNLPK